MTGPFSEQDERALMEHVRQRQAQVGRLIEVSERICQKLESPTAAVTIFDQEDLRAALNALAPART